MKIRHVLDFEITPVSLRRAWDIRRACEPTCASPIWPSSSARGTSAATESTTRMSTAFERTSISVMSRACSPVSGWETSRLSVSTPRRRAYRGSRACSVSTKAAIPPCRWALATIWRVRVVFPEASGP